MACLYVRLKGADLERITDTEIDWKTYMIQVELYIKGERDYSKIYGPTGPLVCVLPSHCEEFDMSDA
jgi:hypothetical protein